ncbi:MAG TPA: lysylphosphatidylglycerol synthase domain-containing protein [Gammaproteobacteria bacterium]|nr:lysylphosphatidylglycerol synthase domain-containing protein [Gammaproteobacteria bacterium]
MPSRTTVFYLKLVLLPLGIGCLLYWATQEETLRQQARLGWELSAGALLSLVAMGPLALRFKHALKVAGFALRGAQSLRINALSAFYHFFVPLSIGAELTKFVQLKMTHPERGALGLTAAILLDHVLGFAALLAILIALFTGERVLDGPIDVRWIALAVIVVNGLLLTLAWQCRARLRASLRDILERLMTHRLDAAAAVGWSIAMQALMAAALLLPAQAWGMAIEYREFLFVLAASSLFAAIPLNVAGIGAAEIAGTGLYIALGLNSREAVLLVSLMVCYRLLFAVLGGVWDFAATRRRAAAA